MIRLTVRAALLATAFGCTRLAAQTTETSPGLWAAQNSLDAITLTWTPVPGATGYRLFCAVGDQPSRPVGSPAGNSTHWVISLRGPAARAIHQCELEPRSGAGVPGERLAFNPVQPQTSEPAPTAPATVTATQTAATEITLTWDPAPGATAYSIARAAAPGGFVPLCRLCPNTGSYVDRDVSPGRRYTYAVTVVSPHGASGRTVSNSLTPGSDATLAGDAGGGSTTGSASGSTPGSKSRIALNPTLELVSPGEVTISWSPVPGATSYKVLRSVNGGPFQEVAAPAQPMTGGIVGALGKLVDSLWPVIERWGSSAFGVVYQVVAIGPMGPIPTANEKSRSLRIDTRKALASRDSSPKGPGGGTTGGTTATPLDPSSKAALNPKSSLKDNNQAEVRWSPIPGAISYSVFRSVEGRQMERVAQVAGGLAQAALNFVDNLGPLQGLFPGLNAINVVYRVVGTLASGEVVVAETSPLKAAKAAKAPSSPSPSTLDPATPCILEYQRADNMWAARGRPDGNLGTERLTLASGVTRTFVTDWKYEKSRGDGSNLFGSHARVVTNAGKRPVTVLLKFGDPQDVRAILFTVRSHRSGGTEFTIPAGQNAAVRADLMEASCPTP